MGDYDQRRRPRTNAPYPMQDDYGPDPRGRGGPFPPPNNSDPYAFEDLPPTNNVPPPPLGAQMNDAPPRPALKREGSRSRLPPDAQPRFEPSELGGRPHDLEAKDAPRHQRFRDMRDGYESDEGESHRKMMGDSRPRRGEDPRGPPPRGPPRDRDPRGPPPDYDAPRPRRGPPRDRDDFDEPPPPRRRRDPYDDDYPPPRRRREPPGVEYGSEPIPARHRSERRPRRRDDYDDYDDDRRPPPRRRRSVEDHRRRPPPDDDYFSDEPPRRRDDRRRDRSRRRYDDDESDYDSRRDRDRDRRRDQSRPRELKVGKYDVGPLVDKGQKHYATIAPFVTPIVLSMAKKYLGGGGGKR